MKQIERASIMRIVSDMVIADAIIDVREIEFINSIKNKYSIKKEDEILGMILCGFNSIRVELFISLSKFGL